MAEKSNNNCEARCLALGLGQAGCGTLLAMKSLNLNARVKLLGMDGDCKDLAKLAEAGIEAVQLGAQTLRGNGSGGDGVKAYQAFIESQEAVVRAISPYRAIMMSVGMGGGMCGVVKGIFEIARSRGITCLLFAMMPFDFEGEYRRQLATDTLNGLDVLCQTIIVATKEDILGHFRNQPIEQAFQNASLYAAKVMLATLLPFSVKNIFNMNIGYDGTSGILGTLAGDGAPRCRFAQASSSEKEKAVENICNAIMQEHVFVDEKSRKSISRAVALLRVCRNCSENEMEFLFVSVRRLLNETAGHKIELEVAACLDEAMGDYMHLTLLLNTSENEAENQEESFREVRTGGNMVDIPIFAVGNSKAEKGQIFIPYEYDTRGIFADDPPNLFLSEGKNIDLDEPTFSRLRKKIDIGI